MIITYFSSSVWRDRSKWKEREHVNLRGGGGGGQEITFPIADFNYYKDKNCPAPNACMSAATDQEFWMAN